MLRLILTGYPPFPQAIQAIPTRISLTCLAEQCHFPNFSVFALSLMHISQLNGSFQLEVPLLPDSKAF
jgi:hypothetical protein